MSDAILRKINDILDDYGYQADEFDITITDMAQDAENPDAEGAEEEYTVSIAHKASGQEKEYQGDNYAVWFADFEEDLQNEVFGEPVE